MFPLTNCLDVLLIVAIVIYITSYSRDIGSIFYGSMSLYARTLRSAGTRIPTANKCLLLLCLSMQVSAMFSLQEMGSLASIVKDLPKLNDSNYEEWAFRIKCIFVTLGLGATLYPNLTNVMDGRMLFGGHDVDQSLDNALHPAATDDEDAKSSS